MNVKFTEAFKIQSVQKALNRTESCSLQEVANSLGVGLSSLTKWIRQAKNQEFEMASEAELKTMSDEKRPQDWTLDERLEMVIKCAVLDDEAINALCREQGIYPHHIQHWKSDFVSGKKMPLPIQKTTEVKQLKTENKALKKELNRKDRALAETAALLVLQKKVNVLWGDDEDS
jgi:transposase-like protein